MFAERDKHYPSRSGQTSLAIAVTNITKPVTKINLGPSIVLPLPLCQLRPGHGQLEECRAPPVRAPRVDLGVDLQELLAQLHLSSQFLLR